MDAVLIATFAELIIKHGAALGIKIFDAWSKNWGDEGPTMTDILALRELALKPGDLFPGLDDK